MFNGLTDCLMPHVKTSSISLAENQKGINAIQRCSVEMFQRCSVENQKGINAIQRCSVEMFQRCSVENQKGTIAIDFVQQQRPSDCQCNIVE